LVWSVESTSAREGGLDGDTAGLEVSNFADHDDVRVLAQERLQRRGNVIPISVPPAPG